MTRVRRCEPGLARRHHDERHVAPLVARYVQSFLDQTAQTAVSNGRSSIEERLARWLLMAADRLDDEEMPLTHEFLAMMLSVRRPGVTVAVQELERDGTIERRLKRLRVYNTGVSGSWRVR